MPFALTLVSALAVLPSSPPPTALSSSINTVWGDTSWELRHGRSPTPDDAPAERVKVHLEEVLLRLVATPIGHLAPETAARRTLALDALAAYTDAGVFPRNLDDPEARPAFIDGSGRLCAVGAMMAATAGLQAAEAVDLDFHGERVWGMDSPMLAEWAEAHGLTETELALVQPSYPPDWREPRTHRNNAVGIRGGLSAWEDSTYLGRGEGLVATPGPAPDFGLWWLWQPGAHWGLGGAVNVRTTLYDYYEGSRPALSLLLKAEYAEAIAAEGLFDLIVLAEVGPTVIVDSPGDYVGIEFGGGLGLASTLGLWQALSFRVDTRVQHTMLWGRGSETIESTQLLVTLGAEWRFSL